MRIPCPFCGLRDLDEFEYGGDARVAWPALDADAEHWSAATYLRDDPAGRHVELWRHARGCGLWLRVERDTRTHEIFVVRAANPRLEAVFERARADAASEEDAA